MKRNTVIVIIMSLFAIISMGVFTACDEDGDLTKLDMCYRFADAYCTRHADLACGDYSSCYSARGAACDARFDNTCKATESDIDQVDHDIDMIINPKETCAGLVSIESYLDGELTDMASTCTGNNGTTMDIGFMCETLIGSICAKVNTLNCDPSMTLTQCESALLSSGTIVINTHSCTDFGDHSAATSAESASFNAMAAEVNAASSCSDFGY